MTRVDKKKEVKASLPREVRDVLNQRAATCDLSPMSYAARLAMRGLHTEKIVRAFAPYFKRGYIPHYAKHMAFIGRVITPDLEPLLPEGPGVTRMSVKFTAEEHLMLGELAYAFASSLSQALTVLLNECLLQGVEVPTDADRAAL